MSMVAIAVSRDGRRLDHTVATADGRVTIGPAGSEHSVPLVEAAMLLTRVPPEGRCFRGMPIGPGGLSRLRARGFVRLAASEALGPLFSETA